MYKNIRLNSEIIPCPNPVYRFISFRSTDDDRRRSIITVRSASHLFQGEVRSKRGTSLTFEIIFEVERSARDARKHTYTRLYRENIHTYTRATYIMSPPRAFARCISRG